MQLSQRSVLQLAKSRARRALSPQTFKELSKRPSLRTSHLAPKKFCVGFVDNITCKGLPLNLSDLLPDAMEDLPRPFEDAIRDEVDNLQTIANALLNIMFIRILLIVGLVLVLIFAFLFIVSLFSRMLFIVGILVRLSYRSRILVHAILGLVSCLLLVVVAVVLLVFRQKTSSLPSWVEVKHGEVGGLCLGAICCAIVLTFTTAISPALIR